MMRGPFFFFISFVSIVAMLTSGCRQKTANSATSSGSCDTATFRQMGNATTQYRFCYPKSWKVFPPNGVFDTYIGLPFRDSSAQYKKILAVKLENTQNGASAMGNFKKYIDSSRTLIRAYINNIEMLRDRDTTWYTYNAHVFEFTGTVYGRPFRTSQLIIDGGSRDYFYVLNYQQRMDDPADTIFDVQTRDAIFGSFALISDNSTGN